MPGHFLPFYLPYKENQQFISSTGQAIKILDQANQLVAAGAPGVAITYSANEGQTINLASEYKKGNWDTRACAGGANQAQVMDQMELLQKTPKYQHLQNKVRIAPITTISYQNDIEAWTTTVQNDLNNIEALLQNGWTVLGWINQDTDPLYAHMIGNPNAVVKAFPQALTDLVQNSLAGFTVKYPR